jgi:hypothetical protein
VCGAIINAAGRGDPFILRVGPDIPLQVSPMYRISRNDHEPIVDIEHVAKIEPAIHSSDPGRYHVDKISADPLPSGHTSRRW